MTYATSFERKPCASCNELVRVGATVCQHCGKSVAGGTSVATRLVQIALVPVVLVVLTAIAVAALLLVWRLFG